MNYIPEPNGDWQTVSPSEAGFNTEQLAEATNVLGLVQTISSTPTPSARQAMCKALVAELKATAD